MWGGSSGKGAAIGAGTDVAIDSADVVLVKSDPEDIVRLLDLGTSTTRKIKQNLWWGAGYNIMAIPLAAGVLASAGILPSPAVGAVLMSLSTVIAAGTCSIDEVDEGAAVRLWRLANVAAQGRRAQAMARKRKKLTQAFIS